MLAQAALVALKIHNLDKEKIVLPQKTTYTFKEIAPELGVSESSLYTAARKGNLPFPVMRINTRWVVPAKPFFEALGTNPQEAA